jgi:hypothetical protein
MLICQKCGTVGQGKSVVQGSFWIEVLLWLCCLLPGIAYSVWRLTTRKKVCVSCGSPDLIATTSPIGLELMRRYHSQESGRKAPQ